MYKQVDHKNKIFFTTGLMDTNPQARVRIIAY